MFRFGFLASLAIATLSTPSAAAFAPVGGGDTSVLRPVAVGSRRTTAVAEPRFSTSLNARRSRRSGHDNDRTDENKDDKPIPQLPAASSSSLTPTNRVTTSPKPYSIVPLSVSSLGLTVAEMPSPFPAAVSDAPDLDSVDYESNKGTPIAYVGSSHFQLQYTCKVCDTSNCNRVSRLAYRKGLVVAICKGCNSKHLIADNLGSGFSEGKDPAATIEDYFASQGMHNAVKRVSSDVFQLEKILDIDTKSGSLVGDDGKPVLE